MCQFQSSRMRVGVVFELIIDLWLSCQAFLLSHSCSQLCHPAHRSRQAFDWTPISWWRLLSCHTVHNLHVCGSLSDICALPKDSWDCWPRFSAGAALWWGISSNTRWQLLSGCAGRSLRVAVIETSTWFLCKEYQGINHNYDQISIILHD